MDIRELLLSISLGKTSYSVEEDTLDSLKKFQVIVNTIISAENKGLIYKVVSQKDFRHQGRLICAISVRGGLTSDGKALITS